MEEARAYFHHLWGRVAKGEPYGRGLKNEFSRLGEWFDEQQWRRGALMRKLWRTFQTARRPFELGMQIQRTIDELSVRSREHDALTANLADVSREFNTVMLEAWTMTGELAKAVKRGEAPSDSDLDLIIRLSDSHRADLERRITASTE